jgi:NADH dehydrogenase
VIVIDRVNHHLFQPLLYQVALATLAPTDITAPVRWLLRAQQNATVLLGEVTAIDADAGQVVIRHDAGETRTTFDFLVVAAGTRHSYFGHNEWQSHAPGLKSLTDALEIRTRFLNAFERAEWEPNPHIRRELQTFVVVGGGPTGVELAGILPEIVHKAMRRDFRNLNPADTRVLLVEAGPRILPSFSEAISERVMRDLAELGVEVRTGTAVTGITHDSVTLGNEVVRTRNTFWAAGNQASPIAATLGVPLNRQGRVPVEWDLSVPGHSNIFVVGDLAVLMRGDREVPGVAQGALQSGKCAGLNILRTLQRRPRKAFRYQNRGDAATIGTNKAIVDLGALVLEGRLAWFFWLFLHILYLAGFRNRVSVLVEWAYAYFSFQRGARLIVGRSGKDGQREFDAERQQLP